MTPRPGPFNLINRIKQRLRQSGRPSGQGQSLIEFALVLPLLLLLLLGVFDFGRAVVAYVALSESAREGARAGIFTNATDDDIRTAARAQGVWLGSLPDQSISVSPAYPRSAGDDLQVAVVYDFSAVMPLFNAIWGGGTLRMSGAATMKVE